MFVREEALMALCPDYEDAFSHRVAHNTFLFRLKHLEVVVGTLGLVPPEELDLVERCWHSHAEIGDRKLRDRLERQFSAVKLATE
jgi:hypothetical protein